MLFDPRTTFKLPDDTKVIVTFQWLGAPGKHHLTATWRGPRDTSSSSGFDYTAEAREFGAYWQLTLTPEAPLGQWTLEAQVDGQPAGSHTFQLVGPDGVVPVAGPVAPVPLTRQELYARALAATVMVQALDARGRVLRTSAGTLIDAQSVATTFNAIDGATSLRIRGPQGAPVDGGEVLAFDRRQNWTLLKATSLDGGKPAPAAANRPAIGNQCTSAASTGDGAFVATYGEVVGTRDYPAAGARLNMAFSAGDAATGAPVLDEFGSLIGIAGASVDARPGLRTYRMGEMMSQASQVLVLPIDMVHPNGTATTVSELGTRGLFMFPVSLPDQILSGGFAASILRDGARTQPVDERDHFSRQEKKLSVFVTWDPKKTLKSTVLLRVFDADNRVLGETKPMKVTLRPGTLALSSWEFGVPQAIGIYHAEIFVGADLVWRGFFDVTE